MIRILRLADSGETRELLPGAAGAGALREELISARRSRLAALVSGSADAPIAIGPDLRARLDALADGSP